MSTQKNEPRALALGVAVYIIWGFFPLYFSLLSPAGAVEVIVHRAVWGLFFCLVALALTGSLGKIRALIADRGALWRLAVAGALVVVNWSVYVYAVLSGHTTDAAIGYFINPLVTIALGLIVLRERVTPIQKIALALGRRRRHPRCRPARDSDRLAHTCPHVWPVLTREKECRRAG